ncbi:single-stranded DNA-binding protein [Mucilaginibacter aquariorum]|uniref:Single-stranded DNA-binding protein n=1 Tax=Mucilaginibacter aquariorum TaxID=2967225 RepID=A0ABT1T4P9_9SPHI|nr:single-stranded DNA-binding protein [Mucilaginibacter aquariorum]MCQ6958928.1 single-stranded DNA-binding protein [Mucilaginibacter aquariorum]
MLSNSGINKVLLLGQITNDPFIDSYVNDQRYVSVTLVTNEQIKRGDDTVEHNEYHKIKIPEKMVSQDRLQLQAGQVVFIEGKIHTSAVIDNDNIKRYNLEVIVNKLEVLNLVSVTA